MGLMLTSLVGFEVPGPPTWRERMATFLGKKRKRDDDPEDENLRLPSPKYQVQYRKRMTVKGKAMFTEDKDGSTSGDDSGEGESKWWNEEDEDDWMVEYGKSRPLPDSRALSKEGKLTMSGDCFRREAAKNGQAQGD